MSFALNVRPEAELDIATAFGWYESELRGLGIQFLDALDDAFEKIAENPLQYADLAAGIRRKLLRKFPYGVFFVFENSEIWVLAVLQHAQNPNIWKGRR
jgi:plasmid stabilization system protein ParE